MSGNDDGGHRLAKSSSLRPKTAIFGRISIDFAKNPRFRGCNFGAEKREKRSFFGGRSDCNRRRSFEFHDPVGENHQEVLKFRLFPDLDSLFGDLDQPFILEVGQCPV